MERETTLAPNDSVGGPPTGLPTGLGPSGRAAAPPVQRLRLTFGKGPEIRFIGHLDVMRLWERAFRRARLPLAYTLGYTPHPRLTFAAPLALGATGEAELLDVYLTAVRDPTQLRTELAPQLPPGCSLAAVDEVTLAGPSLPALVRWAAYRVDAAPWRTSAARAEEDTEAQGSRWSRRSPEGAERFDEPAVAAAQAVGAPWRSAAQRLPPPTTEGPSPPLGEVEQRVSGALATPALVRERTREGKTTPYDLRPFILHLAAAPGADGTSIQVSMTLRADQTGAGRPDEVMAALGLRAARIHRVRIGLEGTDPPGG